jgi:formate dehydrogenase accessory protein FdhD
VTCDRDPDVVMMATAADLENLALAFGRASCETVHKAAAAAIELWVTVSAPATLAVECAERFSVAQVGLARPGRHDVCTFADRMVDGDSR